MKTLITIMIDTDLKEEETFRYFKNCTRYLEKNSNILKLEVSGRDKIIKEEKGQGVTKNET